MPVIETNERIDKSMPPQVVLAMLQMLKNYGVPIPATAIWLRSQQALYRQLKAYYDQQQKETA